MMLLPLLAAALAAQGVQPASLNPRAGELFERDPALRAWAVREFDRNGDGWLTLYEAQPAVAAFKEIADTDKDGRVTVREFEEGKAFVAARWGTGGL